LLLQIACGGSSTSPTTSPGTSSLHAETSDPAGDAVPSAGVPNPPDLVHATVDVAGDTATFNVQFAPGTLNRQTTRVTIELDTDQNASTGIIAAGPLGIDFILDMYAPGTQTTVERATPSTCGQGACYSIVGSASLTVGADTMTAVVSLAMLGNASGRLNYRVGTYVWPQPTTPTVNADFMPNFELPPAHVP